jgi:hypothetical protein
LAFWTGILSTVSSYRLIVKLSTGFIAGLLAIGLLAIVPDDAFAGSRGGGHFHYFAAGNPGGIRFAPAFPLTPTPANQASETNNAWATYKAQLEQTTGSKISTGAHR